jgi:hypothetical protein
MKVCVRCQSLLDLATVDVVPPRAAGGALPRALRRGARRGRWRLGERIARIRAALRRRFDASVDWRLLVRSILPGYGHLRAGRRTPGLALLGTWSGLVVLILLSAGSGWAWLFWLMALGLHCAVLSAVLAPALQGTRLTYRMATGLLIYGILCAGLYLPARWMAGRVVLPFRVHGLRETALVANGDTVLCAGPWLRPDRWERGDLVLYRIRPASAGGIVIREGFGLDRIVGVEGDRIDLAGGVLTVNGTPVPPEIAPIGGLQRLPENMWIVPRRSVLILPSTFAFEGYGNYRAQLPRAASMVATVDEHDVLGQVLWRLRPWSRHGRLEHE